MFGRSARPTDKLRYPRLKPTSLSLEQLFKTVSSFTTHRPVVDETYKGPWNCFTGSSATRILFCWDREFPKPVLLIDFRHLSNSLQIVTLWKRRLASSIPRRNLPWINAYIWARQCCTKVYRLFYVTRDILVYLCLLLSSSYIWLIKWTLDF